MQWVGHSLTCEAASVLTVAMTEDVTLKTKKNLLKMQGAIWGATAAHTLWNVQEGYQKENLSYAAAAGQAAIAALCLWKGFEEED